MADVHQMNRHQRRRLRTQAAPAQTYGTETVSLRQPHLVDAKIPFRPHQHQSILSGIQLVQQERLYTVHGLVFGRLGHTGHIGFVITMRDELLSGEGAGHKTLEILHLVQ